MKGSVVLKDHTTKALLEMRKATSKGLIDFAEIMTMKSKEPGFCPRLTGNLASSIKFQVSPLGDVRVVTETGYGGWVHEGTIRRKPNRFFKRAFDATKPEFQRKLKR